MRLSTSTQGAGLRMRVLHHEMRRKVALATCSAIAITQNGGTPKGRPLRMRMWMNAYRYGASREVSTSGSAHRVGWGEGRAA